MGKSCNLVRNLSEPMYKSPRSCFPFTSEKTHRCHNRFYSWLPSFQAMFSRFDTTGSGVMEDGGLVYQYITLWKNGATCRGCPRRWPKFSSFVMPKRSTKLELSRNSPPSFPTTSFPTDRLLGGATSTSHPQSDEVGTIRTREIDWRYVVVGSLLASYVCST